MPNWCFNNYVFEADLKNKEKLEWLRDKLNKSLEKREWFDKLAEDLGVKLEYTRGNIIGVYELESNDKEVWFAAEAETAWSPISELWQGVKENFAKEGVELRFYYFAEEPGMEVYETNDKERKHFWGDEWKVDSSEDEVESSYYDNKKDVVAALNEQLGTNKFTEDMTEDKINDMLKDMEKSVSVYEVYVNEL